jgi:hypothetical protein
MKHLLLIFIMTCVFSCAASAHHLEEVGTYLHLTLSPQGATAEMTAIVSLSVAQTQLSMIDQNGNGKISRSEVSAFVSSMKSSFSRGLRMEIEGKDAPFTVQSASVAVPGNSATATTFRISATLVASWPEPLHGPVRATLRNDNFAFYFGNSMIWLHSVGGVKIDETVYQPYREESATDWRMLLGAVRQSVLQRIVKFRIHTKSD